MNCCNRLMIYTTRHTTVCTTCGIEKSTPFSQFSLYSNQNNYDTHAPLIPLYSRKKRFGKLLDAILSPYPQVADEKMLMYLDKHRRGKLSSVTAGLLSGRAGPLGQLPRRLGANRRRKTNHLQNNRHLPRER